MRNWLKLALAISLFANAALGVGLFFQTKKLRTAAFLGQLRWQALVNADAN